MKKNGENEVLRCSFCNKDQNDVRKLIAGPAVYVCDKCVALASAMFAGAAAADQLWATQRTAAEDRSKGGATRKKASGESCSFCGKAPAQVDGMADGGPFRICAECIDLCNQIIEEERKGE